uniref:T-cell immunomodulatory protein n=1 Tax=Gongylonema pulchrum TaxID=637853 RepID=A0A183DLX8_9BILA
LSDTDTVRIDGQYYKPMDIHKDPFHTLYVVVVDHLNPKIHYVEAIGKYTAHITYVEEFIYIYTLSRNGKLVIFKRSRVIGN